jgi:hypothetical protein
MMMMMWIQKFKCFKMLWSFLSKRDKVREPKLFDTIAELKELLLKRVTPKLWSMKFTDDEIVGYVHSL